MIKRITSVRGESEKHDRGFKTDAKGFVLVSEFDPFGLKKPYD